MMARAPEWRSLSLAVQHVAKFKGTEAAAKLELEHALAQGLKTRASRISAWSYPRDALQGFDPRDGLPTSIWQVHDRSHKRTVLAPTIKWEKNSVTGYIEGRNNAETEWMFIDAEDVEVYWADVLKCWPDRTEAKREQLKPQSDRALIKPQRDRALVWLNKNEHALAKHRHQTIAGQVERRRHRN